MPHDTTSRPRRLPRALALLLAGALLAGAAACGDDGDDEASGDDGAAEIAGTEAEGGAVEETEGEFPVTVEHKYGTTEVTEDPERIVTVGLSDHDAVLALGKVPVGIDDWFGERPLGVWPWTEDLWGGAEPALVGERDEFNVEQIAELRPDLILGLYSGMTEDDYETLSQIAPTVAQPVGFEDYAAPWQDMTLLTGQALGREEQAQQLIDDIDARYAEIREAHPELAEQTVAVVDPYEPGQYAAFRHDDPKVRFMTEMGFQVPDDLTEAIGDEYALELSSERLDLLDVDRLVFMTSDETTQDTVESDEVYATLDVAQEDRALFLPYDTLGGALSFSTVLSIPYAIDEMEQLVAGG